MTAAAPKSKPCPLCGGSGRVLDNKAMGQAMRIARKKAGVSGRELARRLGLSAAYVSDLELGRRGWNADKGDYAGLDRSRRRKLGWLRQAGIALCCFIAIIFIRSESAWCAHSFDAPIPQVVGGNVIIPEGVSVFNTSTSNESFLPVSYSSSSSAVQFKYKCSVDWSVRPDINFLKLFVFLEDSSARGGVFNKIGYDMVYPVSRCLAKVTDLYRYFKSDTVPPWMQTHRRIVHMDVGAQLPPGGVLRITDERFCRSPQVASEYGENSCHASKEDSCIREPPVKRRFFVALVLFVVGFFLAFQGGKRVYDKRQFLSAALLCGGYLFAIGGLCLWLLTAIPGTWGWWL